VSPMSVTCARVSLGGRWQEMEEKNVALRAELQACHGEAVQAELTLAAAESERRAAEKEADASCRRGNECAEQVLQLQSEATFLSRALAEAAEDNARIECCAQEFARSHSTAADECSALRQRSEEAEAEMSSLRRLVSEFEGCASQEQAGRREAETRCDCLQAELSLAEARLTNRGTHVDLLLRDKERLWVQLERARRRGDGKGTKNDAMGERTKCESRNGPSTPVKSREVTTPGAATRRTAHNGTGAHPGGSQKLRSSSVTEVISKQDGRVADLERKIWHLQRALDKERAGHEQTREALLSRGPHPRSNTMLVRALVPDEQASVQAEEGSEAG